MFSFFRRKPNEATEESQQQPTTTTTPDTNNNASTVKADDVSAARLFGLGRSSPQFRTSSSTSYDSAGGGEHAFDGNPSQLWRMLSGFLPEERQRHQDFGVVVRGIDVHQRTPQWMENKEQNVDGTPLREEDYVQHTYWQQKYRQELEVGRAVQEVKRAKRMEADHDVVGMMLHMKRLLGFAPPLDENYARAQVEARHRRRRREERREELEREAAAANNNNNNNNHSDDDDVASMRGLMRTMPLDGVQRSATSAAWHAVMEVAETGQPLATVAHHHRQHIDFYGLDAFLDSSPSLMWFSCKCGLALGLLHGTIKAMQAIQVDVQFLKASGVGVLSILNMSVAAAMIKWGGNMTLFAAAFCVGDRATTRVKHMLLPRPFEVGQSSQQQQQVQLRTHRSTINYVVGLASSGAMVGVLPWWVLSDATLARRMAASGVLVGASLGAVVGVTVSRMVALNMARLDATPRQLRRYEALMQRQRRWKEEQLNQIKANTLVWW